MEGNRERVNEVSVIRHLLAESFIFVQCTTSTFEGMIAMIDPGASWVAKWQRIGEYSPNFVSQNLFFFLLSIFHSQL